MSKPRNVLLPAGLLADRPAAADVISGTLYPATDTGIIYRRKEDVTWENWDDFGGGGSTPTGTGFRHVTSDVEDATVKLVEIADVASSLKPSGTAASTDESLRRLGTGSTHAAAGDDSRFPSTSEKNALAGTSGTPGSGNKYVTDGDARLTDSRAPSGSAGGALDGTFPNPGLNASVAGAGLAESSDVLSVNVDGSTLEINTDTLRVKAGGITSSHIADGTVAVGDLAFDPATQAELDAHTGDATDAHAASAITNTPDGNLSSTDVQSALNELDSEKAVAANAVMDGDSAGGALDGTFPNPGLASSVAGTGLTEASDVLSVNYGTSSTTACVGNDSRLSDARTPTGSAGGALAGTYPNPTLASTNLYASELVAATDATIAADTGVVIPGGFTINDGINLTISDTGRMMIL